MDQWLCRYGARRISREGLHSGKRKLSVVMTMLIILIVMASQTYTCVKTHQIVHLNLCQLYLLCRDIKEREVIKKKVMAKHSLSYPPQWLDTLPRGLSGGGWCYTEGESRGNSNFATFV